MMSRRRRQHGYSSNNTNLSDHVADDLAVNVEFSGHADFTGLTLMAAVDGLAAFEIDHGAETRTGLYHKNEDRYCIHPCLCTRSICDIHSVAYYACFDGHGGSEAATYCERHIHRRLLALFSEQLHSPTSSELVMEKLAKNIKKIFTDIERDFMRWARDHNNNSGTCVCIALIIGNNLVVSNLGDCRVSLWRSTKPKILEVVHSRHNTSNQNEVRRVNMAGGILRDELVNGILEPTRTIGDADVKDWRADVILYTPEIRHVSLFDDTDKRNDESVLLVLATDGLWDVCSNEVITEVLRTHCLERSEPDLKHISELLIDEAIKYGSEDDITVIVVRVTRYGDV